MCNCGGWLEQYAQEVQGCEGCQASRGNSTGEHCSNRPSANFLRLGLSDRSKDSAAKGMLAMTGERLGQYRLTERIGEGKMGVGYSRDKDFVLQRVAMTHRIAPRGLAALWVFNSRSKRSRPEAMSTMTVMDKSIKLDPSLSSTSAKRSLAQRGGRPPGLTAEHGCLKAL